MVDVVNPMNYTHIIMIAALAALVLASCDLDDIPPTPETVEFYYVAEPCEEKPEWYAQGPEDVSRTQAHLADEGIESTVRFVDRGAVCLACIIECAPSYLVAVVTTDDGDALKALGWSETYPFEAKPDERLFGTWQLVSAQLPEGDVESATLTIDADSIGGRGPCNTYGGSAVFADGTVSFSEIFSTLMHCEDVMDQELAYFEALGTIDSYRFENGRLVLSADGYTLTFEPYDTKVTLYYAPNPCEGEAWYPGSGDDVDRAEAHFADQGIEAGIGFEERPHEVFCDACMPACSPHSFTAEVPEADVERMRELGWSREHPFPDDDTSTFYYADTPCEENPEWYATAGDVARTEAYLSDNGIEAHVEFVDRGAVCRACLPACAASYLIARVSEGDADAMRSLGWTSEHPFPDDRDEPHEGTTFTYTPVQCEQVPWDGRAYNTKIYERYTEHGLSVSNIERRELDVMVCEACYVCPTNIEFSLVLEEGSPDVLVRDGWVGGPSCEETGCSPQRTCTEGVCTYDGLAVE